MTSRNIPLLKVQKTHEPDEDDEGVPFDFVTTELTFELVDNKRKNDLLRPVAKASLTIEREITHER